MPLMTAEAIKRRAQILAHDNSKACQNRDPIHQHGHGKACQRLAAVIEAAMREAYDAAMHPDADALK